MGAFNTVADDRGSDQPNDTSEQKRKRRLRPTPTVRERSEQAAARAAVPKRRSKAGKVIASPFRLAGRIFRPLGRFKLFRGIGYIIVPPYLRRSWRELRLVDWPSFRETRDLTAAVIIFSIIFGILIAAVDFGLDHLFRKLILNH